MIDNKLKFDRNTEAICRKGQERLYFLRRINWLMMSLFYKSFIQSVLTFSFIAWYKAISVKDKNNHGQIIKVAGKLIGCPQSSLQSI